MKCQGNRYSKKSMCGVSTCVTSVACRMNSIIYSITFISESATMGKQRTAKKLPAKIASRWKDQRLKASGEEAFWAEKEKEKEEKGFKPMIQEPTGRKGKQQQKDKLAVVSSSAETVAMIMDKKKQRRIKKNKGKSWT